MAIVLALTYPLTASQAEQIVTIHKDDTNRLDHDLESVRTVCIEKCQSNTIECVEHSKEVRRLWRNYYTNFRSGSWASYRSTDYIIELRQMFDSKADIEIIHARVALEKRMHDKDALCTVRINDDPMVKKYKQEAAAMFDRNATEFEIREFIRLQERKVTEKRSTKQVDFDSRLASCKNEDERRAIYREDACTPFDDNTPAMAKLQLKWQGLFESGMPYIDIYSNMQKDLTDHLRIMRELREKLDGLQRAKAAHDKAEIAKEANKAAKDVAATTRMFSNYTFYCTTDGCQNLSVPISEDKGNLECGICNQLVERGMRSDRSYFCSEDCMERDGFVHILGSHGCAAGTACTTGNHKRSIHENYWGTCPNCWENFGTESYFCSSPCWIKNWTEHSTQRHAQLRTELIEKLENSQESFNQWKYKVRLTAEEIQRALTGVSFITSIH